MNTYCPNLSNAQVRQEFNDLVQAVGEDQAYLVWHRNNGYALTSAPNGAESLLFQKLLEKYHGDYNLAMQKKAAMYLSKYTDQNGKWYEGKSKIQLDENGEPIGTADNKILLDEQKEFASIEEEEQYILEHAARDENGKLLAPNGKPSNLTEKQYAQVRTKAFKEWFGDWERVIPSTESAKKLISYVTDIYNRNNRFSKLAKLLLDNGALPYNLKYFKIDNNRDDIEGASGMWHSLVNYIEVLGNNVSQESIDKHLLHELIHYNTEQILQDYKDGKIINDTKKEAIKSLYDIITYAKDFLSKDLQANRSKYVEIAKRQSNTVDSRLFYAFDNQGSVEIDEFISEIFTNPGFQEVLNNIPYKESKKTIWDKIKDAICSIFGFDINKGSVLEEALKASSNLLQNNNNVSKVVDENGEPFVAYAGVKGDFTVFDSKYSKTASKGFFFTADKEVAKSYGNVKEVFLNIKNLKEENAELSSLDLENGKYDGISYIHEGAEAFVVWNPNQIESATDNVGTSSTTDNNTYYLQTPGNTQDVLTNLFSNDNIDIFLKGDNTQQLLQQLINDSYIADPFKPFAEVLARHDIPIIISEENSNNLMSTFVDNNGGVVISINPKVLRHVSTGFAAEKLMHEVVHALTTEGLREDSPIFDRKLNRITEKLFNLYNKQFPSERFSRNDYTNGYNGLQDKYEFVAEFLTNQSFRQLLFDKAKQLDKNNNKQSVLQSLKSFVQNIINFLVNKKSNTENLEKYQLQLFDYINNKNAIVNGNIKSEQQLKDLIKSVDTYKFIAENVLECDE